MTRVNNWCLAPIIQDGAAIVVFAVLGMLSHDGSVFVAGFVRDAVPLLVGWFGVALVIGTYRRPSRRKLLITCLLYTSPSPRDRSVSRMPSSA